MELPAKKPEEKAKQKNARTWSLYRMGSHCRRRRRRPHWSDFWRMADRLVYTGLRWWDGRCADGSLPIVIARARAGCTAGAGSSGSNVGTATASVGERDRGRRADASWIQFPVQLFRGKRLSWRVRGPWRSSRWQRKAAGGAGWPSDRTAATISVTCAHAGRTFRSGPRSRNSSSRWWRSRTARISRRPR